MNGTAEVYGRPVSVTAEVVSDRWDVRFKAAQNTMSD